MNSVKASVTGLPVPFETVARTKRRTSPDSYTPLRRIVTRGKPSPRSISRSSSGSSLPTAASALSASTLAA